MNPPNGGKSPKILFIPLEFLTWGMARHLSHGISLGFEDGFEANGLDFLTLPGLCAQSTGVPGDTRSYWLGQARSLCRGIRFDQVWVEVVHNHLDAGTLDWIAGLAPVRVAILGESLEYEDHVKAAAPHLLRRKSLVEKRLEAFTHCLAADETDADNLSRTGPLKAMWWASVVSEKFIGKVWNPHPDPRAIFAGSVYGERKSWLDDPALMRLLIHQSIPPEEAGFAARFDELNAGVAAYLDSGKEASWERVSAYLSPLRRIRHENFANWIKSLGNGSAVVNLPSFFQGYAGRVVEAMAAGRPVVSWQVPGRPRNLALFKDGEDILLFRGDDRERLREHLERLAADPGFGRRIAANAMRKLWRFHTMEKRIGQVLRWIETGREPDYMEGVPGPDLDRAFSAFHSAFADSQGVAAGISESRLDAQGKAVAAAAVSAEEPGAAEALEAYLDSAQLSGVRARTLAELHLSQGDSRKAAYWFMEAIKRDNLDVTLWTGCAKACLDFGDSGMAKAALEGAMALDPGNGEARALLAALLRTG